MSLSPRDPPAEAKPPPASSLLAATLLVVVTSAVVPVALYLNGNRGVRVIAGSEADASSADRAQPSTVRGAPPPAVALPAAPKAVPAALVDAGTDAKAANAEGPGFLTIHTTPRARVSEHGRILCTATPCARLALAPGVHTIALENKEESLKNSVTVSIASGETTTKRVTLNP